MSIKPCEESQHTYMVGATMDGRGFTAWSILYTGPNDWRAANAYVESAKTDRVPYVEAMHKDGTFCEQESDHTRIMCERRF